MSRKRAPEAAGIKIHVKREDFEGGYVEEEEEEVSEQKEVKTTAPQPPLEKKRAKRPWATSGEDTVKNPFAGAKFGAPSGLSFSSSAFGGAASSFQSSTSSAPANTTPSVPSSSGLFSGFGATKKFGEDSSATTEPAKVAKPQASSLFSSQPAAPSIPSTATVATQQQEQQGSQSKSSIDEESSLRAMAALNANFLQYIEGKIKEKPDASLLSGVKMYLEYCARLDSTDTAPQTSNLNQLPTSAAKVISSGVPESTTSGVPPSLFPGGGSGPASGSVFSNPSNASSAAAPFFSAGTGSKAGQPSNTVTGSLFSSGGTAPSGGLASGSLFSGGGSSFFSGGGGAVPTSSLFSSSGTTSSLFSGGSSSTSLFSGAAKPAADPEREEEGEDDDGDEEEVEPSGPAQKVVNEDEDILYEVDPCKIMVYKDQQWTQRGKGRAVVSKDKKTGKYRVVLRAGTTGNLYFNAPVNRSMLPSLKVQKASFSLMTISYTQQPGGAMKADSEKPLLYRFTVSSEAEANKFKTALEQAMSE